MSRHFSAIEAETIGRYEKVLFTCDNRNNEFVFDTFFHFNNQEIYLFV